MNLFDIIGPVMIGPSSSHTAGAVRLGRLARSVLGDEVQEASIGLHGSFALTYRGHGTDLALVAGLMGWKDDDERIRRSFDYARDSGLQYSFAAVDLGELAHPNSVRFQLKGRNGGTCTMTGCSVGGGRVKAVEVDAIPMEITCEMPTLLTMHEDRAGVIANVTRILAERGINVARMSVFRQRRGGIAAMAVETDQHAGDEEIEAIKDLPNIIAVRDIHL